MSRPITMLLLHHFATKGAVPLPYGEGLPFEAQGFGVNEPGAWLRLYATVPGYCREFGWRACFFGAGCE